MKLIILLIIPLLATVKASIKDDFLSHCSPLDDDEKSSIGGLYGVKLEWNCLSCKNLSITPSDSEMFEKEDLNISGEECFVFERGDIGVVNADFFKQFPNAAYIIFKNVNISLKSSKELMVHKNLEYLEFSKSNISRNSRTNALHSLENLSALEISMCLLENTTIDSELLKRNVNLKALSVIDDDIAQPSNHGLTIKNIEDSALENLLNLKSFYIQIRNMTQLPKKLLQGKPNLTDLSIGISCQEFPEGIDESVDNLEIYFCDFKKLTRNDLRRFKNLVFFGLVDSALETIDEDTFDDLKYLRTLFLEDNQLKTFTTRHLQNNSRITSLSIENNPIENLDLKGLPLEENSKYPGFYVRKVAGV